MNPSDQTALPTNMALRLSLFYGALFIVLGVAVPFWPMWLTARGLDATDIGIVLAAGRLTPVIASPIVAHIADVHGNHHRVMTFLAAGTVGGFLMYGLTSSFWTVLPVAMISACFFPALIPLSESLTIRTTYLYKLDYGRIRLWGSVSFIVFAAGSGFVIDRLGVDMVLWMIVGAAVVILFATAILPHGHMPNHAAAEPGGHVGLRVRQLVFQKRFLLFLSVAGLIQASHAVYYGFGTLHWLSLGYSKTLIGILFAEGVIAEIVLFAMGNRIIARMGPERLLLAACALGAVRWLATGAATSLSILIAVQLLHAMTYAAAHLAAMHFIQRNTPTELSATAQSVYASMSLGVFMAFAIFAAGSLYAASGGGAYNWMAGMAGVATLGAVFLIRAQRD